MSLPGFLVTGAHGFIGAWVIKRLLAENARVVMFDQSADPKRLRLIMEDDEISRATFIAGDITSPDALLPVIRGHNITHIIHLAGLQVPTCRVNPRQGAMVNVIGTINVFEAALQSGGQVQRIAYASSAAVFGSTEEGHAVREHEATDPTSHYGAFKRCNEDNARVYFLDHKISSIGLRPLTVYGVGRDFGLTSDPTKAMKAAVVGRPFHIRFGGRTDFLYAADCADAFIRSAKTDLPGAYMFNLHGESVALSEVVRQIESAVAEICGTKAQITHADHGLPIPSEMDDTAIRQALGDLPSTSLREGIRITIERFAVLHKQQALDTSDLDV
jgi:nucleoside-diphosphate-sugar epimerase